MLIHGSFDTITGMQFNISCMRAQEESDTQLSKSAA
jgi:hypothetical protein